MSPFSFPARHGAILRRLAAALAIAGLAASAQARTLHIELHASADAAAARVTLADIATLSNADDASLARLGALDVGRVAVDGTPTIVDRAALARWVQVRTGVRSGDVVWSGAEHCSVRLGDGVAAAPALAPALASTVPAPAAAPLAVVHGNLAALRSISGPIAVESRVEVLDDGAVGQDVHVRLPGATEAVVARVTAPGRVEVSQ